jgi:hypothetical protein
MHNKRLFLLQHIEVFAVARACLQGEGWVGVETLYGLYDRVEEQEQRGDTRRHGMCK